MNHSEKTHYHQTSDEYLRSNQVRELFQKAVGELAAKQPDKPLDFLIDFFRQRKKFRVFSVIGFEEETRKHVVEEVSSQFNLKVLRPTGVSPAEVFLSDSQDYAQFIRSFSKHESNFDGVLLDNFPSTLHQLACLKREKVIVDRIFALLPAHLSAQALSPEQQLQVSKVREVAREMSHVTTLSENSDLQKVTQRVSDNVFIKLKQQVRTPAPRLLFFHHPARPELGLWLRLVAKYYDLHVIDMDQLLADQRDRLARQGALSHEVLTRRAPVPDDVPATHPDRHRFRAERARQHLLRHERLRPGQLPADRSPARAVRQDALRAAADHPRGRACRRERAVPLGPLAGPGLGQALLLGLQRHRREVRGGPELRAPARAPERRAEGQGERR